MTHGGASLQGNTAARTRRDVRITAAERIQAGVRVGWSDGRTADFHGFWLRDNCPCSQCRHPLTLELVLDHLSVPADVVPRRVERTPAGELRLTWEPDGHQSAFDPDWLRDHAYSQELCCERRQRRLVWGAELASAIPRFAYSDVIAAEDALLAWLRAVRDVGVALVTGVPTEEGMVTRMVERVAFVHPTNFGFMYDVHVKLDPRSNAHTALGLELHTDLPHHPHPPGVQFFHCLRNEARGGECILVDGFRIAEILRRDDRETFEILTRVPVDFRYTDERADHRYRGTMIRLDAEGEVIEVRFAPNVVAPLEAPFDRMPLLRRAYLRFAAMTRREDLQVRFRYRPGDLLVNDNLRVLHGRTAFDAESGVRHLQGCYMDHSELLSRIRVLERTHA